MTAYPNVTVRLCSSACAWSVSQGVLKDSAPNELHPALPVILVKPMTADEFNMDGHYACPVYTNMQVRGGQHAGVPSTPTCRCAQWRCAGVRSGRRVRPGGWPRVWAKGASQARGAGGAVGGMAGYGCSQLLFAVGLDGGSQASAMGAHARRVINQAVALGVAGVPAGALRVAGKPAGALRVTGVRQSSKPYSARLPACRLQRANVYSPIVSMFTLKTNDPPHKWTLASVAILLQDELSV